MTVATTARDKARQTIDIAAGVVGRRNTSVISAEAGYSTGVTYLNAGSYAPSLASFRSAFLKTQGIR